MSFFDIFSGPIADANKIDARQSDFSDFITGAGSEVFGNAGTPCTVGYSFFRATTGEL